MGQNGGLAFLIPYLACVALFGIPMIALEIGAGMHFSSSYFEVLKRIRFPKAIGAFPLLLVFFILSYYVVITSWMLFYSFGFFAGMDVNFSVISGGYYSVFFLLATVFLMYVVLSLGIHRGVEPFMKLAIALLAIFMAALAAHTLSQPDAFAKTLSSLSFDASFILLPKTWLFAVSQAVFSLSIGMGLLLTYASYVKRKEGALRDAVVIAAADTSVSLLAVLVVFPLVFLAGFSINEGTLLSMDALPLAFANMPFGGLAGGVFFLCIFIAAFTSALSMAELQITALESEKGMPRQKAVNYALFALLAVSLIVLLSYSPMNWSLFGMPLLDLLDYLFGTLLAPLSALVVCVALGHYWKTEQFLIMMRVREKWLQEAIALLVKLVIPLVLAGLFLHGVLGG